MQMFGSHLNFMDTFPSLFPLLLETSFLFSSRPEGNLLLVSSVLPTELITKPRLTLVLHENYMISYMRPQVFRMLLFLGGIEYTAKISSVQLFPLLLAFGIV